MKCLLSFAIGAILGDIFFHLIPESVGSINDIDKAAHKNVGLSIIAGIFMFVIVEMVLQRWSNEVIEDEKEDRSSLLKDDGEGLNKDALGVVLLKYTQSSCKQSTKCDKKIFPKEILNESNNNESTFKNMYENNNISMPSLNKLNKAQIADKTLTSVANTNLTIDPAGYLNLIANGFDNFTHGLAIGASFLVGPKVGLLTTFVIIVHEIPHEICDYAILVKSGFSRWDAVKAQSSVSLFGILGTATALYVKSIDKLNARTSWILPFSAGGFLYIALVTLLPDILDKETNLQNSLRQIGCVILGIAFMGLVALF
jgi:zinc transporter 13